MEASWPPYTLIQTITGNSEGLYEQTGWEEAKGHNTNGGEKMGGLGKSTWEQNAHG